MNSKRWLPRVLMLLALAAGLVLGYLQIQPSLPLPEGFAPEAHSPDTAGPVPDLNQTLRHVEAMAQAPHPSGSEALAACQAYLREQLGRMGYACQADSHELTVDDVLLMDQRRVAGGGRDFELTREDIRENLDLGERERFTIRNLWVRVDAPDTDELILFVAHTDSTRYGPGAFDDTVAVASMLEALRLLKEAPLRRDLLFLFTDGEEQLMLGAASFAARYPGVVEDARMVINLEARGTRGVPLLFESSDKNLNLIRAYAVHAPRPAAFSPAAAIYRGMRNETDLSVFMQAGCPGINLAVIEGFENYHNWGDNADAISRESAWQYLRTVCSLALGLAAREDLALQADQDGVFFLFLPGYLLIFPERAAGAAAVCAAAVYLALLIRERRRGSIRVWRAGLAAALRLLVPALFAGISKLIVDLLIGPLDGEQYMTRLADGRFHLCGLLMLAVFSLAAWLVWRRLGSRLHPSSDLGVLMLPALLAPVSALLFPGGSYLFTLPLILGLLGHLAKGWGRALLAAAQCFVTLLLFVPLCALIYHALGFEALFIPLALALTGLSFLLSPVTKAPQAGAA